MLKLKVTGAASLAGCNHRSQFNSFPAPYDIEVSGHQPFSKRADKASLDFPSQGLNFNPVLVFSTGHSNWHQLTLSTYVIGARTATIALWLRECFLANEPIQELLVELGKSCRQLTKWTYSDNSTGSL